MDGFYVAKIQKLSDKVKGEAEHTKSNEVIEETPVEEDATNTKDTKKPQKKHGKKGKKRKSNVEQEFLQSFHFFSFHYIYRIKQYSIYLHSSRVEVDKNWDLCDD